MIRQLIYILIIFIFLFVYLRYFEHNSLYFPMEKIEFFPDAAGLSFEDIYLKTDDGERLNAWLVPAEPSRYTVLFCHGNGGNIGYRIEKIGLLNKLGLSVFIFEYRGYGNSSGRPSEKGLYKDAEAAYNYLVLEREISPNSIILYGESLGGAVALDIAAKKDIRAVVIESTFSSTIDMAKTIYPFLPSFLISSKFDSLKKIKNVKAPKLIIHSSGDEIVPVVHSLKLLEASAEPKKYVALSGSHNTAYMDSKDLYLSGIREFLDTLL